MTLHKDVFLRSHVVEVSPKEPRVSDYNEPKWPEYALVFDTETTLDPKDQSLLFGFYRVCLMQNNAYQCVEEGILHADDLTLEYRDVIARYVRSAQSEVVHKDYDETIHVYSRSEFMERIFFDAVRTRLLLMPLGIFHVWPLDIGFPAIAHGPSFCRSAFLARLGNWSLTRSGHACESRQRTLKRHSSA
jgi:hypothetical protein